MNFIDKNNIMPEYIDRTIENLRIIEEKRGKSSGYEVTQLINSFVGLLILPKEEMFRSIDDSYISQKTFSKLQTCVKKSLNSDETSEDRTLKNIIRHLRNGVAHFHIKFAGNSEIEEIYLEDCSIRKHENITFEATFDVEFLNQFIKEFAENVKGKASLLKNEKF